MGRKLWLATMVMLALSACRAKEQGGTVASWPAGRQSAVAQGGAVVLAAPQADVAVILDEGPGFDVRQVMVSAVELPTGFLVETVDPLGRYLPAVAVSVEEGPVLPVRVAQVKAEAGFALHRAGTFTPQAVAREYVATMRLDELPAVLGDLVADQVLNILFPQGMALAGSTMVDLYTTDGQHTWLVMPAAEQAAASGPLMAQLAPQPGRWLSLSTTAQWLASHSLPEALH